MAPQGRRKLEEELSVFADEDGIEALSPRIRLLIEDLRAEWRALDERIAAFDGEFVRMARDDETVRRLTKISWDRDDQRDRAGGGRRQCRAFRRGRDMAAWLGLTPRQMTTGGKPRLLGISKRGNRYLRKNLIHGARAALPYLVERETPLGRWARGLRRGPTRTLPSLRWPTSLRALLGRSWPMAAPMTPNTKRRRRRKRLPERRSSRRVTEVCVR